MNQATRVVPVTLPNGRTVRVEATVLDPEQKVSFTARPFQDVLDAIEGIASSVASALEKVKPARASVELGVEVGLESGGLTALIVKGSGNANMKVTLEWGGK